MITIKTTDVSDELKIVKAKLMDAESLLECLTPDGLALTKELASLRAQLATARREIGTLLANLDHLAEATGEGLEGEDAAIVGQIRTEYDAFNASQEKLND